MWTPATRPAPGALKAATTTPVEGPPSDGIQRTDGGRGVSGRHRWRAASQRRAGWSAVAGIGAARPHTI